jgi:hypothetical protein
MLGGGGRRPLSAFLNERMPVGTPRARAFDPELRHHLGIVAAHLLDEALGVFATDQRLDCITKGARRRKRVVNDGVDEHGNEIRVDLSEGRGRGRTRGEGRGETPSGSPLLTEGARLPLPGVCASARTMLAPGAHGGVHRTCKTEHSRPARLRGIRWAHLGSNQGEPKTTSSDCEQESAALQGEKARPRCSLTHSGQLETALGVDKAWTRGEGDFWQAARHLTARTAPRKNGERPRPASVLPEGAGW